MRDHHQAYDHEREEFDREYEAVERLSNFVREIIAATTREEVGKIHADMAGYDTRQDIPTASLRDLKTLALDYVKEQCYEEDESGARLGVEQSLMDAADAHLQSLGK